MMKKFALFFAFAMLFSFVLSAQPQLSWRFANAEVINAGAQFQFDIEVMASASGTFQRDLQIYFDYNTTGFGSDIVTTGNILVSNLTLMENYYSVVNMADNTTSKFAIITEADNEMTQSGSAADFNEMPSSFTGLLRITIDILDNTAAAGIVFDEALMNGGQYHQSTSGTDPLKYTDPCLYDYADLDLSTFILSTMYGQVTYFNAASTPLSNTDIVLKDGAVTIATTTTDLDGNYTFSNIGDGSYTLETSSNLNWGGCDIFDINFAVAYILGQTAITPLELLAGDVDLLPAPPAGDVNIFDVNYMVAYVLAQVPAPPNPGSWPAAPYVFGDVTGAVTGGIGTVDYEGACSGDMDAGFTPF